MPATDIYYSALHYAKKARAAAEDAADIRASLTNVFEFKGTVDSVSDLPAASVDKTGWVYIVGTGEGNKSEYVCTGTAWEELGPALVMTDASTSTKGVVQLATNDEVVEGTNTTKAVVPSAGAAAYGRLAGTNTWQGSNTFNGVTNINGTALNVDSTTVDMENAVLVTLPHNTVIKDSDGTTDQELAIKAETYPWGFFPTNKNFNEMISKGVYYVTHTQAGLNAPVEWVEGAGSVGWVVRIDSISDVYTQEAFAPTSTYGDYPCVYRRRRLGDGTWEAWMKVQKNTALLDGMPNYSAVTNVTLPYTASANCRIFLTFLPTTVNGGTADLLINNITIGGISVNAGNADFVQFSLSAGDVISATLTGDIIIPQIKVTPFK